MFGYKLHYIDIDVQSWKWGDIRKTTPFEQDDLEHDETSNASLIVVPSAGSPKCHGYHGGIVASDALYASGIIPKENDVFILLEDDELVAEKIQILAAHVEHIDYAYVHTTSMVKSHLSKNDLSVEYDRPPIIHMTGKGFSESGQQRMVSSIKYKLVQSFLSEFALDLDTKTYMSKQLATYNSNQEDTRIRQLPRMKIPGLWKESQDDLKIISSV